MSPGPIVLRSDLLALPGLVHGFGTRQGGVSRGPYTSLNLSTGVGDEPAAVAENRRRFAAALGLPWGRLVGLSQEHGREVLIVDRPAAELPPEEARRCDASVSDRRDVALAVRTADCLPILLFDPVRRAVGAAHAGWRGTLAGVATAVVQALGRAYGCKPVDVRAALGPCIQRRAFAVGPDVHAAFLARFGPEVAPAGPDGLRVDLPLANRALLLAAGLRPEHVELSPRCTCQEADWFFSHRRDGGRTGRQVAIIHLDPCLPA